MDNYKKLRNKIVHDYEGIKLNFIWDIITYDLPVLKKDLVHQIKSEPTPTFNFNSNTPHTHEMIF